MRLEIAMQNTIRMTATNSRNNLTEKRPNSGDRQPNPFIDILRFLAFIHVALQVKLDILKNKIQPVRLRLNDIIEFYLY